MRERGVGERLPSIYASQRERVLLLLADRKDGEEATMRLRFS